MLELYSYGKDVPIIHSFLCTDEYKLTTAQLGHTFYPNVVVKFALTNRTKEVRLAELIPIERLRTELDHFRTLRITKEERKKLKERKTRSGKQLIKNDFLDFLENLKVPDYQLGVKDGQFELSFEGKWAEVTHWEIPALTIINTLANEYRFKQNGGYSAWEASRKLGSERTREKIAILLNNPLVRFIEFGTRRADSPSWQEKVVLEFADSLLKTGQLLGTSNVYLALKHDLSLGGTMPHEGVMVYFGIFHESVEEILASQNIFYNDWEKMYGLDKSIFLPDTYGTEFTLRTLPEEKVRTWDGFRPDSKDPIIAGEELINFYKGWGIDPMTKLSVPSDGLTVPHMVEITDYFNGRLPNRYGLGTSATNDVGLPPLSIVVKVVKSNGYGTVKLSDNLAKAIGTLEDIEYVKNLVGYTGQNYVRCIY